MEYATMVDATCYLQSTEQPTLAEDSTLLNADFGSTCKRSWQTILCCLSVCSAGETLSDDINTYDSVRSLHTYGLALHDNMAAATEVPTEAERQRILELRQNKHQNNGLPHNKVRSIQL